MAGHLPGLAYISGCLRLAFSGFLLTRHNVDLQRCSSEGVFLALPLVYGSRMGRHRSPSPLCYGTWALLCHFCHSGRMPGAASTLGFFFFLSTLGTRSVTVTPVSNTSGTGRWIWQAWGLTAVHPPPANEGYPSEPGICWSRRGRQGTNIPFSSIDRGNNSSVPRDRL